MSQIDNVVVRVVAEGAKQAAGEIDSVGGAVEGLHSVASKMFAAAGVGFGMYEAAKAAASFNAQMERLQTQAGASGQEVHAMTGHVLNLAVGLGTGPSGLADSLYHIESAGFRGATALTAMKLAAEGAKVGNADLVDTTTGLTAVMVAGFHGVSTLRSAMGDLNATVGAGDMTFQNLNDSLNTGILATFRAAHMTVTDFGAAMATLGDNNIRGSHAAVMLRQAVLGLMGPSDTAKKVLAGLSIGPEQLSADLQKPNGLLKALEDLKGHLRGLSSTTQEMDVVHIFGRQSAGAILTLMDQMDRLRTKYEQVTKGANNFGSAWKHTTETQQFFLDQAKALGEVILVRLGDAIWAVVGFIVKHESAVKHLAEAIGIAAVAWGAYTLAMNAASIAETIALGAMYALDAAMAVAPWLLLIAAIYELITHWKEVEHLASVVGQAIGDAFTAAANWVVGAWHSIENAASDVLTWIEDHWKLLVLIFFGVFGAIADIVSTHWKFIESITNDVVNWIVGAFNTVEKPIEAVFNWVMSNVVNPVTSAIVSAFKWAISEIELAWKALEGPLTATWDWIESAVSTVLDAILTAVRWVVHQITQLWHTITGPISSVVGSIGGFFGGVGHSIGGFLGIGGSNHPHGHAATGGWSTGGVFEVGEHGREQVYLPAGSMVVPNSFANTGLAGSGSQPLEAHVVLQIGKQQFAKAIAMTNATVKATS